MACNWMVDQELLKISLLLVLTAHPQRMALDLADGDEARLAGLRIDVIEGRIGPGREYGSTSSVP